MFSETLKTPEINNLDRLKTLLAETFGEDELFKPLINSLSFIKLEKFVEGNVVNLSVYSSAFRKILESAKRSDIFFEKVREIFGSDVKKVILSDRQKNRESSIIGDSEMMQTKISVVRDYLELTNTNLTSETQIVEKKTYKRKNEIEIERDWLKFVELTGIELENYFHGRIGNIIVTKENGRIEINIKNLVEKIAKQFEVKSEWLLKPKRKFGLNEKDKIRSRNGNEISENNIDKYKLLAAIVKLIRDKSNYSLNQIGTSLSGREYTTVLNLLRKAEQLYKEEDPTFLEYYNRINTWFSDKYEFRVQKSS